MGRGLSRQQIAILNILDEKHGTASTKTLKIAVGSTISNQSFYRSLQNLEKRGEIRFFRGGRTGGLVCKKHGNVLLVDVDSMIPNLALMKLSAWHNAKGDNVLLRRGTKIPDGFKKYDIAYISCIFSKNARSARRLAKIFSTSIGEVHLGGSGVDLKTTLPDEIERMMPDYDLYPECDYSLGYCSRGCIRKCPFCIVPEKEGHIKAVADIYQFWDRRHKKIVFLDNNIFALPEHFKLIANQVIKEGLRADWNQGLDIRLLDDEKAALLKKMRIQHVKFAWDDVKSEASVRRGIEILKAHGIKMATFYVLVGGPGSTFEDCLYRVNTLRELGQACYVMPYNKEELFKDRRYFYLFRWANARQLFFICTYEEFVNNWENGERNKMAAERRKRIETEKHPPPVIHGFELNTFKYILEYT